MTDKATTSLRQRCDTALQSLPDAAYKTMLAALFDDLLGLAAQAAPTEAEYNPLLIDGVQHDPLCLKVYRSPLKECDCGASSRAAQPSQAPVVQAVQTEVRFKYESMKPIDGYDAIYAEYATTFGRYPDDFMSKVVRQTKEDLFMWWGAHREKIRAGLVLLAAQEDASSGATTPAAPFAKDSWQHAVDNQLVAFGRTSQEFANPHEALAWLAIMNMELGQSNAGATTQAVRMLTDAARDVLAERQRQISAEGWTPEHDDEHDAWSMAVAAACYSLWDRPATQATTGRLSNLWQWTGWDQSWFKPKDPRRNLVRAAALLLAEIERLDRAGRTIPPSGEIGGA